MLAIYGDASRTAASVHPNHAQALLSGNMGHHRLCSPVGASDQCIVLHSGFIRSICWLVDAWEADSHLGMATETDAGVKGRGSGIEAPTDTQMWV